MDKTTLAYIPLDLLVTETQVRTQNGFEQESINDLALSIKSQGLLQPLLVRPSSRSANKFTIVAGHRRLAALTLLKQDTAPCLVTAYVDGVESLPAQLVENLQREALTLADLVKSVREVAQALETPEKIAKALGKSKTWVSKHLSVTGPTFSTKALELIQSGKVTDLEIAHAYNQIAKAKGHDDAKGLVLMKFDTAIDFETITRQGAIALLDEFKRRCKPVQNEISYGEPGEGKTTYAATEAKYIIELTEAQAKAFEDKGGVTWLLAELGA